MYAVTHGAHLARKTMAEYRAAWRHVETLESLTPYAMALWQTQLLERYSRPYANLIVHVFRSVARRSGAITGDLELERLAWALRPVPEYDRAPRCPPRDTLARALTIATNPAERAWLYLAGLGGLRRGELLGLRAGDWEPSTNALRVLRQRRSPCRKNHRAHVVILDYPPARQAWVWTLENRDRVKPRRGYFRGGSDGYAFPWSLRFTTGLLQRIAGILGPEYFPPGSGWHLFRHWGASELARTGASVWELQRWLGDADPTMACTYVDLVRGESRSGLARVAQSLI